MPTAKPARTPSLLEELRKSRRHFMKTGGPVILVALISFVIAFYFVEPPPPNEVVIAAGPADGNYYAAARRYGQLFAENGVKLTIRETAGSVENYDLLLKDDSVRLAIVQGGTAPKSDEAKQLESLSTLYLEPMWVFYRGEQSITELSELKGKRIAVGKEGSGTQVLAEMLLAANGVHDGRDNTVFVRESGLAKQGKHLDEDLEAAFFVLSAESPHVRDLLADEQLHLLNFERGQAYALRYPFLKSVTLARGVLDFEADLPRRDVTLIAPVANLVATHELHDAFIPLLLEAAKQTHTRGGLVADAGQHPSLDGVEFPPNAVAVHYLEDGPSFFQKYLGFWVASLIDRTKIVFVPLIVLLIPLVKLAPPVYRWRIRSRIYSWYALLREIDQTLREDDSRLKEFVNKLGGMERELEDVTVPLSYMEEFYHLRLHIDLVKRRLEERLVAETQSAQPDLKQISS